MRRILCSVFWLLPLIMGFTNGEQVIRNVMVKSLKIEAKTYYKHLEDETNVKIQKLLDDENHPLIAEINALADEARRLDVERSQVLKAKRDAINSKVQYFNNLADRYVKLKTRYDELRPQVESLGADTEALVSRLHSEIQVLSGQLNVIIRYFVDRLDEASAISERLQAYIDSINNGTLPEVQDIEAIQAELEAAIQAIVDEVDNERELIEDERIGLNQWIDDQQDYLDGLIAAASEAADDYNEFLPVVQASRDRVNEAANNYNSAAQQAEAAFNQGDWGSASYWADKRDGYEEDYNRAIDDYYDDKDHLENLERRFNSANSEYERENARIQREFSQKKSAYEQNVEEYNQWVEEQDAEAERLNKDAQTKIDRLSEVMNTTVGDEEAKLKAVRDVIISEFGNEYAQFADVMAKLVEDGNWETALELMNAISTIGAKDGSMLHQAHTIVIAVVLKERSISSAISQYNQKLSQLNALIAELNQISSELEGSEGVIQNLVADLERYAEESRKPIQDLLDRIAAKEAQLADELQGEVKILYELLALQGKVITAQTTLIAHVILIAGDDVADDKDIYDEALAGIGDEKPADIIEEVKDNKPAPEDETEQPELEVVGYNYQYIKAVGSIEEDAKKELIPKWWNILRNQGELSEEAEALKALFGRTEGDIWDFLYSLFVNGFFIESNIDKVTFADDTVGYRVVVDGETYWLNEVGQLEQHTQDSDLFGYFFETPDNTAIGSALREAHQQLIELFGQGRFDELTEEKKNAVVLAEALLRQADKMESQYEQEKLIQAAKDLSQIALGFTPVGDGIDFYEMAYGESLFGEKLSPTQRVLSAMSIFIGSRKLWEKGYEKFKEFVEAMDDALEPLARKFLKGKAIADDKYMENLKEVLESATKYGLKTADGIKAFVKGNTYKILTRISDNGYIHDGVGYRLFNRLAGISNPFPQNATFARVIPKGYYEAIKRGKATLSGPARIRETGEGINEVFITALDDIKDLSQKTDFADKLSLYKDEAGTILRDLTDHVVMKFKFKEPVTTSIRSPYETDNSLRLYGFINGGKTKGGAREWLINNDAAKSGLIDLESVEIVKELN